nr:aldo/keto reductase [Adlercreutzia sp. ZJ242]
MADVMNDTAAGIRGGAGNAASDARGGDAGGIKKLGFGLMRLPVCASGSARNIGEAADRGGEPIDVEQVCAMVDEFMGAGFSYFDTAFTYHDGASEPAIKRALVDRYPRESFQLATKLPAWAAKSAAEARGMLDISLARTGAGYFDYYLLHNLGGELSQPFEDYGLWEFVQQKKAEGLIRHAGFSIHDNAAALDALLTAHPEVDFVQLQINYADWENPKVESRKCYEVARAHGLPVIVMEPVKGGSLVKLPPAARAVLAEANPSAPLASWALRFAASLPGVLTVLSGMSNIEQMRENVGVMRDFKPLTAEEAAVVERVRGILDEAPTVPCTDCRYCVKGCPQHIGIPAALESLNIMAQFGDERRAKENYAWSTGSHPASSCIGCGACERVCPQHIAITSELARAAELFE